MPMVSTDTELETETEEPVAKIEVRDEEILEMMEKAEENQELVKSVGAFMGVRMLEEYLRCPRCGEENVTLSLDCCGSSIERTHKNASNKYQNEVVKSAGEK
jgi:hypothetical protein